MHKKIFAIFFTIILFFFSIFNFIETKDVVKDQVKLIKSPKNFTEVKAYTVQIDTTLATNLVFGYFWNESYGAINLLVGKNEENNFKYVRDKNGFLYSGNFWNTSVTTAKTYAQRIRRMQDFLENRGKDTKVVVLPYPTQYNKKWSDGYYGMVYTDYTEFYDEFMSWLRYYNIKYIDYTKIYEDENKTASDLFYKTDHHWHIPAAFEAFLIMTRYLNEEFDENLDEYYLDENNYIYEYYAEAFIGSQGRETGIAYSGLDDYTMIIPKFKTNYYREAISTKRVTTHAKGSITDTLIKRSYYYKDDYYLKDLNNNYLDGVVYDDKITNLNNPDGLNCLFIRDSYASPVATFFSSYCSQMELLWAVNMESDVAERIVANGDYDYIFVAMEIDSIASDAFNFFASEKEGVYE